jgi:molybdate transport system substrate-binding protein
MGFRNICMTVFICLIGLSLTGCRKGSKREHSRPALTVAAASNVQYAMEALARDFETSSGINIDLIISSSGKLAAQIGQGAPYHVFVSADEKYPAELARKGLAGGSPQVYAYGALVLWTVRKEVDISRGLAVLENRHIRKIALANPGLAPYGEQSIRVLEHLGLLERLRSKLVYGENISQTSQYILSGACDLGFTAKSIVLAPELKGRGAWVDVPPAAYRPIAQAAVITRQGIERLPEESRTFFTYLLSEPAQAILSRFGYTFIRVE